MRGAAAFAAALALAGCAAGAPGMMGPPGPPARPAQPEGWNAEVSLAPVTGTGNVVEFSLDARVSSLSFLPGTTTPAWTYNGTVPGPLIRARVGDRVVAHFTNHLPEATTVHWHGIRLPSAMDGVPGHTQAAVPPGGSFDYSFVVPDAGLFWYHPHVASARQVGDGLYGAILVEDPTSTDADEAATLGDDLVLVLSDIDLGPDGALGDPTSGGDFGTLFGRQGNTLLVNGKVKPTILARAGLRQRWRLVNASKSRYYQIALDGHAFTLVGVDGGFLEQPLANQQTLVVVPGGRADVVVEPQDAPGTIATVHWVPYDRGYGSTFMIPQQDVFYVKLTDDAPWTEARALPDRLRTIAPLDVSTAISRSIKLTQTTNSPLVLSINGVPADMAEAMPAKVGTTEVWTVENTMAFDHPFHVHGFFFQPLDDQGAPLPSPRWLDTVNVPQMKTTLFAIKYDDRPGMWMFHCHILDHADAGMMGMLLLSE
ncbi:MAG TPA: multicopper oxidase family protein [Polyangia bacterium]|nr:multicopper oxidase family protein [Polyangia bacterium]